jgi:hypothetical protein
MLYRTELRFRPPGMMRSLRMMPSSFAQSCAQRVAFQNCNRAHLSPLGRGRRVFEAGE